MHRILISACLIGRPVRYDGAGKPLADRRVDDWLAEGRLVPLCPEMLGGLSVPRPPAEIVGGNGADVLAGRAIVVTATGEDVTAAFLAGAVATLDLARREGCGHALLIDRSPSCGSFTIYDGSFSGRRMPGAGVVAALLAGNGIAVFADHQLDRLAAAIAAGEGGEPAAG
jgi:uncharacterized protein YbbK (DUF523 family)